MATIILKYDKRNSLIKSIIHSAILAGATEVDMKNKSDYEYNPEFVKMVHNASKESKRKLTPALKHKYFGSL